MSISETFSPTADAAINSHTLVYDEMQREKRTKVEVHLEFWSTVLYVEEEEERGLVVEDKNHFSSLKIRLSQHNENECR